MKAATYNRLLIAFLAYNAVVWVVWGVICLFMPEAWSGKAIAGMDVYDLTSATARTEVRAMYGGLQIAIGLLAVVALLKPQHCATTLLFYVLAMSGLALSRAFGLWIEHSEPILAFSFNVTKETYNQIGLATFELPDAVFAWILLLVPRLSSK